MATIDERLAKCESDISHLFWESSEIHKKVDDLTTLTTSVSNLTNELKHTNESLGEVKKDIKSIKDAPANRWNAIITAVCSGIACTIITALVSIIIK